MVRDLHRWLCYPEVPKLDFHFGVSNMHPPTGGGKYSPADGCGSGVFVITYGQTSHRRKTMKVSLLAGMPADPATLVNVPNLVTAYYVDKPDP